jgi:hypothetical protein
MPRSGREFAGRVENFLGLVHINKFVAFIRVHCFSSCHQALVETTFVSLSCSSTSDYYNSHSGTLTNQQQQQQQQYQQQQQSINAQQTSSVVPQQFQYPFPHAYAHAPATHALSFNLMSHLTNRNFGIGEKRGKAVYTTLSSHDLR